MLAQLSMAAWQSWSHNDCRPIALRPCLSTGLPNNLFFYCKIFTILCVSLYNRAEVLSNTYYFISHIVFFYSKKNLKDEIMVGGSTDKQKRAGEWL